MNSSEVSLSKKEKKILISKSVDLEENLSMVDLDKKVHLWLKIYEIKWLKCGSYFLFSLLIKSNIWQENAKCNFTMFKKRILAWNGPTTHHSYKFVPNLFSLLSHSPSLICWEGIHIVIDLDSHNLWHIWLTIFFLFT